MKILHLAFLFIAATLYSTILNAQSVSFTGIIQDAHTKEPVSYASIYFTRSGIGKTSDGAGNFSFYIGKFLKDTMVVTYVGYEVYKIALNDSVNNKTIVIQLQRGAATNGVMVKSKINKGLFLWKKIMSKKKQYNRYNLSNFGYEAYNKLEIDIKNFKADKAKKNFLLKPFAFVFDNMDSVTEKEPFLPAYLLESVSDYAFQKNTKKYFENIKASNTKGFNNESINKFLGVMNQNVNTYGNYVTVMDKDFIGPFNDNADVYYNFAVPDTQTVNGKKIFHFVFAPKHAGQNTFEGDAWVFAQSFQIQKINLYLGKDANINYIDRISVFQEFIPINDSVYFLNRDKFFADFKVMGKQSLTFIGRKTTSYRNIIINSDSITNLFKQQPIEEVVKTSPGSNLKTDSVWNVLRHDTLSANEKAIYTTVDKLLQMPKFQRLQNTLKFIGTGYKTLTNYEIGPWFNWISSNNWEGTRLRFDLGTTTGFNKHIYLHTYLAYGFGDKKFKYEADGLYLFNRNPRSYLFAKYSSDIDYGQQYLDEVSQDNIFALAIRKSGVPIKFLFTKEARVDYFKEWHSGFSVLLNASSKQYDPLRNLPSKTAYPAESGNVFNNFETSIQFRFAYLEKFFETYFYRYSLGSPYPIGEIKFSKGISGILNSSYNYTKVSGGISDLVNIPPYGTFYYNVFAGKTFGTLPFMLLDVAPGNEIYYYNRYAYSLLNRWEYVHDKYFGFGVEHNFGAGLFRFIPFTRKLKFRQFWTAKGLWGSLSDANTAYNTTPGYTFSSLNGKTYMEVGTGVDNILKFFRLDFVWRVLPMDNPNMYA